MLLALGNAVADVAIVPCRHKLGDVRTVCGLNGENELLAWCYVCDREYGFPYERDNVESEELAWNRLYAFFN